MTSLPEGVHRSSTRSDQSQPHYTLRRALRPFPRYTPGATTLAPEAVLVTPTRDHSLADPSRSILGPDVQLLHAPMEGSPLAAEADMIEPRLDIARVYISFHHGSGYAPKPNARVTAEAILLGHHGEPPTREAYPAVSAGASALSDVARWIGPAGGLAA